MSWINDIWNSLNTDKQGVSGRKLSAAISVLTAVWVGVMQVPESEKIYVVWSFLTFSAVCLGLVTIPELIKFLKGGDPKP